MHLWKYKDKNEKDGSYMLSTVCEAGLSWIWYSLDYSPKVGRHNEFAGINEISKL